MDKDCNDLLIIVPPSLIKNELWAPLGAMYIGSALKKKGYTVKILNIDTEAITENEIIERIKQIKPRFIGYSCMVGTSYKYIKNLSHKIKTAFPKNVQIFGGGLSSAADVVLRYTAVDIVVYGEGDVTIVELIGSLSNSDNFCDLNAIRGIYYKNGPQIVFTGTRPLILDIDTIPYPAFDLLDMDRYLPDALSLIKCFTNRKLDKRIYDKNRNRKMMNIITSRGCIGSCGFCSRPDAGLRMNSLKYIFDLIEYCKDKFNVGFFSFGDECFAPTKKRNWDFINEYKRRNPDIMFRIAGLRVDSVDEEILRAYKEIGCFMINFGFESGSQKILNIIDKRVTVEQNRKVSLWTNKAGMYTPPQLILGMPGETNDTIRETINFLKSLDYYEKQYKFTYALPFPGSQLYNFAMLTKAIEDEDEYLTSLGEIKGTQSFHINLTDEQDCIVAEWRNKIGRETYDHYFYKKYRVTNRLIKMFIHFLESLEYHIRQKDILLVASRKLEISLYYFLNMKQKRKIAQQKYCRFRKKRDITIEEFVKGADWSSVNRDSSLKNINEKLSGVGISES